MNKDELKFCKVISLITLQPIAEMLDKLETILNLSVDKIGDSPSLQDTNQESQKLVTEMINYMKYISELMNVFTPAEIESQSTER